MSKTESERRLIENEVIFKRYNVGAIDRLQELHDIADAHGQADAIPNPDSFVMHFYCECADTNCRQKIKLKPNEYKKLHSSKRRFIIKPGHEVQTIEKVVSKKKDFIVVEKFDTPPAYSLKTRNLPQAS